MSQVNSPDLSTISDGEIVLDGRLNLRKLVLLVSEGESQRVVRLTFQAICTIEQAILVG